MTVDPDRLERAEKHRELFQARAQERVDAQVKRLEGQIERVREIYSIEEDAEEGIEEPAQAVASPAARSLGGRAALSKRSKPPKHKMN
jgi:hypothetical protein